MEGIRRYLRGYVLLNIQGEQLERFLNLCRSRQIPLYQLRRTKEQELEAVFLAGDIRKLFPIRRKTKVHIRIRRKQGLPFVYKRCRKRKGFLAGIALCVLVIFLFSTRVWNIHLEGNILNSTPQLLEFLEENGIHHGMAKSKVNCSEIADLLRQNYPEITWVSAKLTGTRLLLSVQEGQLKEEIQEEEAPCDIRANVEGTIVSMVTRTGIPLVKTGDLCQKGDLLVLGRLDILNDDQEVIRHEYVHADADIYIQYQLSYYEEFPLEYETEVLQDQVKKGFLIRLGNLYFSTFDKAEEGYLTSVEEFPLRLTENYILPVRWGRITAQKYEITTAVYSTEEAKSVADAHIARYEENLIQKGLQIFENNVKIDVTQTACISSGTLTVIEKAGTETAAQQLEEPEERTA